MHATCARNYVSHGYIVVFSWILIKHERPRANWTESTDGGGSSNNSSSESRERVAATSAATAAATAGPPLMYASDTDISGKEFALN